VHLTLGPRRVHDPDDESTMILLIISNYLPDNMAQNPRGFNPLIARLYATNRKPVKLEKY
jgi:hypothetical protein